MKAPCLFLFSIAVACILWACQHSNKHNIATSEQLISEFERLAETDSMGEAKKVLHSVLALNREIADTLRLANAIYLAARTQAVSGNFPLAFEFAREGVELSRPANMPEVEYKLNNILIWSSFEMHRGLEEILQREKRQVQLVQQLDREEYTAGVYNNYGYDLTVAGTLPLSEALQYLAASNVYYAKQEGHEGLWYTLMNLTWIYRLMGDLDHSITRGRQAVAQAIKDNDRHAIIEACTNLAETYLELGQPDLAGPLYELALPWSQQEPDRDKYVFDVYHAHYLGAMGQQAQAIEVLEAAVEYLKTGEVFYEMLGRFHLAQIYGRAGQTDKVKEQIQFIRNPRYDYVSFEVKALAEKLAATYGMDNDLASALANAERIGAGLLVAKLKAPE